MSDRVRSMPLAGLAAAGAAVYGLLAALAPFLPHADQSLDIGDLLAWPWGVAAYAALLAAAFLLYVAAYRRVAKGHDELGLRAIVGSAALFCGLLLFLYPLNATDVYRYLMWGNMVAYAGLSPYATTFAAWGNPLAVHLAGEWADAVSPYGPLWHLLSAPPAWLAGDPPDVARGVLALKALSAAAFLATTPLVWTLTAPAGRRTQAARALLWAWNPPLLLSFAGHGHNDSWMLLWLMLGLWVGRRGRPAAGLVVMALAALTKPIAAAALLLCAVAALRSEAQGRRRLQLALLAGLGTAAVGWLLFLPFQGWTTWLLRLGMEASGASFSPQAALILLSRRIGWDPPVAAVNAGGIAAIGAVWTWLAWRVARGRSLPPSTFDAYAAYLLLANGFRLWYAAWPLPWALVDVQPPASSPWEPQPVATHGSHRLRAGLWLTATAQLAALLYGPIRVHLLRGDMALAHGIGVPLVLGLPWLLAARLAPDRPEQHGGQPRALAFDARRRSP